MNLIRHTFTPLQQMFAIMAIFALVFGPFAGVQFASAVSPYEGQILNSQSSVSICHSAGGSGTYSTPPVNVDGIITLPNGHNGHDNDIIPPFVYDLGNGAVSYLGKNWQVGQAIWNNNCVAPTVTPTTDLSIVKTVSNSTPNEGTNVTYTLTVTNAGPSTATNVVVTDTLPAGVSFVSSVPAGGSPWNLGSILSGGNAVITIVVATALVDADTLITNTASVAGTETDTNSVNNISSVPMTVKNIVIPPNPGTIIVDKVTVPAGDAQSFTFVTTGTGYNGFSLTDTATPNSQQLAAGTYSVAEDAVAGWTPTSATCSDGSSPTSISLSADEVVTCTFTNTRDTGSLTILKDTDDVSGDSVPFDFSGTGAIGTFDVLGNSIDSQVFSSLPTGSYTVTELAEADWTFGSVSCAGTSWNETTNGVVVNLAKGDNAICTFTNTKKLVDDTTLTVLKQTNIDADPTLFSFMNGDATFGTAIADGGSTGAIVVSAGTKTITEVGVSGWTLSSVSCVNEAGAVGTPVTDGVSLTFAEGDDVTCTFNNTKDPERCTNETALNYGEESACEFSQCVAFPENLLVNGSFEEPVIGGSWGIFNPVANWVISLSDGLELWANGFYGGASDGNQNVELDGNAPTMITQAVTTVPGATYELRFDFSARPDHDSATDNSVDALVEGSLLMNATASGADISTNTWSTYAKTFVATDASTDISLKDVGADQNSLGSLVDNAVLCLVQVPDTNPETPSCTLTTSDSSVQNGQEFTLSWDVPGADYVTITGIEENKASNGSLSTSANSDTTYTLTAYTEGESDEVLTTCSVSVDVQSGGGGGGGGSSSGSRRSSSNSNNNNDESVGEVLGEATSTLPVGAPNTGAGGTSPVIPVLPSFFAILAEGTGTRRVK